MKSPTVTLALAAFMIASMAVPCLAQGMQQQGYPSGYEQAQTDAYRAQAQMQNSNYQQPLQPDSSSYARQQLNSNASSASDGSPIKVKSQTLSKLKGVASHLGSAVGRVAMPVATVGGMALITRAATAGMYPMGMGMSPMGMGMSPMGMSQMGMSPMMMGGGYGYPMMSNMYRY